jgi:hypothetical protein
VNGNQLTGKSHVMLDKAKTSNSLSTLLAFSVSHLSRLGSGASVGLPSALPHMHHSIAILCNQPRTNCGPRFVDDTRVADVEGRPTRFPETLDTETVPRLSDGRGDNR